MTRIRSLPVVLSCVFFAVQAGAMLAPGGTPAVAMISDATPFLVAFAAGAACLVASARQPGDRALWVLLGLGTIAWGIGDVAYSVYGLLDFDPSGLSFADVGYLILIPLWAAALIAHPSRSRRGIDRLGTTVDAMTISAVVATLTAAYVLVPALGDASDVAGAVVNLVYPVCDLVLLVVLVSILARSAGRFHAADVLIASATAVFAIGDIVYARLSLTDAYDVGHPVDLAWSIAFVLIAAAAGRALAPTKGEDEARATVPVLAAVGIAGMAGLAILAVMTRLENTVVLSGAVATGLLLVARLVVLLVDRARLVRSYDEKVKELEDADIARERFIATVSHDLRSPLASISGFAELLREPEITKDPGQVAEMTSAIERNARRLARLTEDLLCAGQFASGHPPSLRLMAVDLRQTAEEVVRDMGREDVVTVVGSRWIYAMADRNRVMQVLSNLLDNAFKHSGSKEVTIRVEQDVLGSTIEVSDGGIGIPSDRIGQIFEPFVSDFNRRSSAGLGLYVVANLVAAMKGRVSVTSELDHGTTFRISLPAAEPDIELNVQRAPATSD